MSKRSLSEFSDATPKQSAVTPTDVATPEPTHRIKPKYIGCVIFDRPICIDTPAQLAWWIKRAPQALELIQPEQPANVSQEAN